jgi:DNA-binding HxlR family transcriptional regulator
MVMLGHNYDREICSAARALEIAGERWSLLILRNAAFGRMTRFSEFEKSLRIAPNVLAARLERFVEEGLMTVATGSAGHQEYHLTEKGLDFKPVIVALTEWGDRWAAPDGAPIVYEHEQCGHRIGFGVYCKTCAESVKAKEIMARKTEVMSRLQQRRKSKSSGTKRVRKK